MFLFLASTRLLKLVEVMQKSKLLAIWKLCSKTFEATFLQETGNWLFSFTRNFFYFTEVVDFFSRYDPAYVASKSVSDIFILHLANPI